MKHNEINLEEFKTLIIFHHKNLNDHLIEKETHLFCKNVINFLKNIKENYKDYSYRELDIKEKSVNLLILYRNELGHISTFETIFRSYVDTLYLESVLQILESQKFEWVYRMMTNMF